MLIDLPIAAIDLDGLEEQIKIYDHSVNYKKPSFKKIDYKMTKLGQGPVGSGSMTIRIYKHKIRMNYLDPDPTKSFFVDVEPNDFVNPPDKIVDDPKFKVTSRVKIGLYAEAGISGGGIKLKAEGGAFQELAKSTWSERGPESVEEFGDMKGYLGLGPFKLESDVYKNEISFETSVPRLTDKYTYKGNSNKIEHTSTITGQEDIDVFNIKAGAGIGGEIDVKKTNPIKLLETNKWHKFLKDTQAKAEKK